MCGVSSPGGSGAFAAGMAMRGTSTIASVGGYCRILSKAGAIAFAIAKGHDRLRGLSSASFSTITSVGHLVVGSGKGGTDIPVRVDTGQACASIDVGGGGGCVRLSLRSLVDEEFVVSTSADKGITSKCTLKRISIAGPGILGISKPTSVIGGMSGIITAVSISKVSSGLASGIVPILCSSSKGRISAARLGLDGAAIAVSTGVLDMGRMPLMFSAAKAPCKRCQMIRVDDAPSAIGLGKTSGMLGPLISLRVPTGMVGIDKTERSMGAAVSVSRCLPSNIRLMSSSTTSIAMAIEVRTCTSEACRLRASSVEIGDLPSNLGLSFSGTRISIAVDKLRSSLGGLGTSRLTTSVSTSQLDRKARRIRLSLGLSRSRCTCRPVAIDIAIGTGGARSKSASASDNRSANR